MKKNDLHRRTLIEQLTYKTGKYRSFILFIACLIVIVTTYLLVLPAFTLEEDTADKLGGINIEEEAEDVEEVAEEVESSEEE